MGEYRNFVPEKNIIITTQILAFFGISETLMLVEKIIKLNFKKRRLKEMDLLTIMVDILAMNYKSKCYVEVVKRNYYCEVNQVVIPKIHSIFLSKSDYKKINEIEKMFEKYYELEVKNEKESILYNYLKEIIRCLKECEVMEVFSDHIRAFGLKYRYINNFKIKVSINQS